MNNLASRGILSVEEMNALFENRLRATVYGSSYRIVRRGNLFTKGVQVYGQPVSESMTFAFLCDGPVAPLNPLPAQAHTGQSSRAN